MNDALALRHKISGSSSIQRSRKIGHLMYLLKEQSSILEGPQSNILKMVEFWQ